MKQFFKDMVTTKDGESFDVGRVLWIISVFTFLGLAGWDVVMNHARFNMQDFGVGIGMTLAAGGAALMLKAKTEPGGEG